MDNSSWLKQGSDKPLFPDLLWSRPENRALAGKLLIVGGNAFEFAAPAEAYKSAILAGVGVVQVLLPDRLRHTVGKVLDVGDFAPTTPSGSFSQEALAILLAQAAWADGVLLAGDFGRNSETAILLEKFTQKYHGQLTLTKDAADYFTTAPQHILDRPNTSAVISMAQLQRLATSAHFITAFTFDMGLVRLVEALQQFTSHHQLNIIVKYLDTLVVAVGGQVSTTKLHDDAKTWRVNAAAHAAVWWLQNLGKPFEALTTAVYSVAHASKL